MKIIAWGHRAPNRSLSLLNRLRLALIDEEGYPEARSENMSHLRFFSP
jgi:hypothetical protein